MFVLWSRRFFVFFAVVSLVSCLVFTSFAEPSDVYSVDPDTQPPEVADPDTQPPEVADPDLPPEVEQLPADELPPVPEIEAPVDIGFPDFFSSGRFLELVITDDPPPDPLFYGSLYVTGHDSRLGDVTIYFPADYRVGRLGLDSSGYLVGVYSGSSSGYLSGVYNNSVSISAWSYPRYRDDRNSDYYDLRLVPTASNIDLPTDTIPRYTVDELLPYFVVVLLGVVIVCYMRR